MVVDALVSAELLFFFSSSLLPPPQVSGQLRLGLGPFGPHGLSMLLGTGRASSKSTKPPTKGRGTPPCREGLLVAIFHWAMDKYASHLNKHIILQLSLTHGTVLHIPQAYSTCMQCLLLLPLNTAIFYRT